MRSVRVVALGLLLSPLAFSQTSDSSGSPSVNTAAPSPQVQPSATQAQEPPSYANYSIMLVNPVAGGGAVVLMHNPKNELEFVAVNGTKRAFDAGYVSVRAVELGELISALKEENARLATENAQLRNERPKQASTPAPLPPTRFEIEAEQKAARRQQLIQNWLTMQNMNRPQTLNLNVTDCTRTPALCVAR